MSKAINRILGAIFFEKRFRNRLFYRRLAKILATSKTVLELGAGRNSYLRSLAADFHITALDIFTPSLRDAEERGIYDNYITGDVRNLDELFPPDSFDAVVAFDLIEHLTKEEGNKLIQDMLLLSRDVVVIYTPNGFLPQESTRNNPFQEHLSGWTYKEMKSKGFMVEGTNGLKYIRGIYSKPIIRPMALGYFIANLSWVVLSVLRLEEYSFSILCYMKPDIIPEQS